MRGDWATPAAIAPVRGEVCSPERSAARSARVRRAVCCAAAKRSSGSVPLAGHADLLRAVEAHRPIALLQQQYQRARVERRAVAERHRAAGRAQVDALDRERGRDDAQPRDAEQVPGRLGQRPEAVHRLGLQVVEFGHRLHRGDALVQHQPRVHVGQVGLGQQRRHVQVDLRPVVQRLLEFRRLAGLHRLHRALEQFHVEREPDLLDLAALVFAEQFAGAADLEVVRREHEAGAEVLERLDAPRAGARRRPSWRSSAA